MRPSCNFWWFGGTFHQPPVWQRLLLSTSCMAAVLCCGDGTFHPFLGWQWHFWCIDWILRNLPATFSKAVETSVHFWSINGTFRPLPEQRRQLLAAFGAAVVPSINFQCIDKTLQQLLVRGGNSRLFPERQRTFRQLSVHPRVRPSTFRVSEGPSLNFPCGRGIFCKLLSTFLAFMGHSVNFPCDYGIFREVASTFRATKRCSINFRLLSIHPQDIPSPFYAATGLSVNISCADGTFLKISVNFSCSQETSVNFPCIHWTVCKFPWVHGIFRQYSLHPWDLLSTFHACTGPLIDLPYGSGLFIRFPYGSRTFRQVPTAFCTSMEPFVNFRQLSVHLQYLPSTSINISCTHRIFHKQSARSQSLQSTSVAFPYICWTYSKLASTFREAEDLL